MTDSVQPKPTFKQFFLRSWMWNLMLTIAFTIVLSFIYSDYATMRADRQDFLVNLIALPLCWTHTVLLGIFSIRRFSKKHFIPGFLFILHFVLSAVVGYYLYMILALFGWAYTMKGA